MKQKKQKVRSLLKQESSTGTPRGKFIGDHMKDSTTEAKLSRTKGAGCVFVLLLLALVLVLSHYYCDKNDIHFGSIADKIKIASGKVGEIVLDKPEEDISFIDSLDVRVDTQQPGCVSVTASAESKRDCEILRLECNLADSKGESLYSDIVDGSQGEWYIPELTGTYFLKVVAHADKGIAKEYTGSVYIPEYIPSALIWPVMPRFEMLQHDMYQVSSGPEEYYGYSHNNGLLRKKHYVFGTQRAHFGQDITAIPNTPVVAAADGKVIFYGIDSDSIGSTGFGKYIILEHEDGGVIDGVPVYTLYGHLTDSVVAVGDIVNQGDIIAHSGSTGGSRIPHVHFEVRVGMNNSGHAVDPLELLPASGPSDLKNKLDVNSGFYTSSVELYDAMLQGGYEYTIHARTVKDINKGGVQIPTGTVVELVKRRDNLVTIICNDKWLDIDADHLEYQYY